MKGGEPWNQQLRSDRISQSRSFRFTVSARRCGRRHKSPSEPVILCCLPCYCAVQQRYCCECVAPTPSIPVGRHKDSSQCEKCQTRLRAWVLSARSKTSMPLTMLRLIVSWTSPASVPIRERCESRYYLPENLPEGAPLVVVLHGCTQSAAGYDRGSGWSQLADQAGFALLFAEQQRANNPNLCFNWFLPTDTKRNFGEALSIRQMIETLVLAHGLDRKRIFVTGLSAGGAMASVMLATYPEVFAGGAIIAGLPYGSANDDS